MRCIIDKEHFYIPINIIGAEFKIKDEYLKYKNLSLSLPKIHRLGKDMKLVDKAGITTRIWLRFRGNPPTNESGMMNFLKNQITIPYVEETPKGEEKFAPDLNLSKLILSEYEGQRYLGFYGRIVREKSFMEYD